MDYKIIDKFKSNKWIIIFATISLSLSVCMGFLSQLGLILLPLVVALTSVVYFLEDGRFPTVSVVLSVLIVVVDLVLNGIYSYCCLASVVISLVIYFFTKFKLFSKGETALLLTVILALFIGIMILFAAFHDVGSFDIAAAQEYLNGIVAEAKDTFITSFEESMAELPTQPDAEISELINSETLGAMFDSYVNLFISVVVVFAFLFVGLSYKAFGFVFSKLVEDKNSLNSFRFELSPIFAYFYMALYLLGFLFGGEDVISISILNLLNVFTFIFAYLGFVFVNTMLKARFSNKIMATIMLVISIVLLYQFAISILSIAGAFSMIMLARARQVGNNNDAKS